MTSATMVEDESRPCERCGTHAGDLAPEDDPELCECCAEWLCGPCWDENHMYWLF